MIIIQRYEDVPFLGQIPTVKGAELSCRVMTDT